MKFKKMIFSILISSFFVISLSVCANALYGDINNDDYLGVEDAVLALKFTTGLTDLTEEEQQNADLDYDGKITTADARLILRGAADIDYIPDHLFSQWDTLIEPTCTEDGVQVCHCYYCDKEIERSLEKTGHKIVAATCTKAAYCSVCNESFGEPAEHTESEGYCDICHAMLFSPVATYKNEDITFGCDMQTLKNHLGTPKATLTDNNAKKPVNILVYYTDYTDLGIFTFTDGKLTQFFSNNTSSEISQGSTSYSLESDNVPETIGDISLTVYKEEFNGNRKYSFCATVGDAYNLAQTTKYTVNEQLNFHLTNGLRAMNKIPVLKYSSDASTVARAHSTDMATRNFFAHENPDGKRVGARLTAGGVTWSACAENIVAGYTDPYGIANGWYNSESHRKNILNKTYKYLGIGYAYKETSDYKYYGTQNFYTD